LLFETPLELRLRTVRGVFKPEVAIVEIFMQKCIIATVSSQHRLYKKIGNQL